MNTPPLRRGWVAQGACRDTDDPDLHYPDGREDSPGYGTQVAAAKRVCERCPVVAVCLAWAVEHEQHGIWGGATPAERQALRRELLAPAS